MVERVVKQSIVYGKVIWLLAGLGARDRGGAIDSSLGSLGGRFHGWLRIGEEGFGSWRSNVGREV